MQEKAQAAFMPDLKRKQKKQLYKRIAVNYELYIFLLPTLIYFAIFHYAPMYGLQLAFKKFIAIEGIWNSPWVGFEHFKRFFNTYHFWTVIRNTLLLSLYQLVAGIPIPIILALLLNQLKYKRYKRIVQTATYAPHFISTVVMVGMLFVFLSPRSGIINYFIELIGGERINFMARPEWFRTLYVLSEIWQRAGWGSIIYLAALSAIDPSLHEAAIVDGASKLQRIRHVDIPGIIPTAVILLILNMGRVMKVGFQKTFLMQTALNLETSEIIATYIYKVGLLNAQYSFSTAVGLFNSVINLILILTVNKIARSIGETSLW